MKELGKQKAAMEESDQRGAELLSRLQQLNFLQRNLGMVRHASKAFSTHISLSLLEIVPQDDLALPLLLILRC